MEIIFAESPLVCGGRQNVVTKAEDSPGKYSEAHSKGSLSFQPSKDSNEEARGSISQEDSAFLQEELARRRELALRQHAFFQLRLHIRRGMNLVAMDRCGEINFYFLLFSQQNFSSFSYFDLVWKILSDCYFKSIQIFIPIPELNNLLFFFFLLYCQSKDTRCPNSPFFHLPKSHDGYKDTRME